MSAGMYLRVLRERQKLTREQLVDRVKQNSNESIKLSDVSLWSIEDGRQEPKGRLLFALIDALNASYEDISRLILDDAATADDARTLAERRLAMARREQERERQALVADIDQVIDTIGAEEARRLADRLMNDSAFFEEFIRGVVERGRQKS